MYAKVLTLTLLIAEGWLLSNASWGATPISGGQSGTLSLANSPYLATADIFVPGGQTLTIEAGVVVQFQELTTGFFIDGTLIARGTSANPILFTSDEGVKQPGQWKGIDVRGGASTNTVLENCIIECASSAVGGFGANVLFEGPPPVLLTNCTIRAAAGNGMTIYGSDPRVLGCTFANNTNFALVFRPDSLPVLRGNTAQGNGKNALGILSGGISRSGSWTKDNLPYTAIDNFFVNNGVTLTIEPGVTVQFQDPDDAMYIDGTLIARGTATNPILFTSDEAVKQPGQWGGIDARGGASTNTVLENCIIECAGSAAANFGGNLLFEAAPPILVTNCTLRTAAGNGITIYASDPRVVGCTFVNNTNFALVFRPDSLPVLRGNTAQGNGKNALGILFGGISRSGSWTKDNLPYTAIDTLFVNNGVNLTIEPGVTVQFQDPDDALYIDGTLIARGTVANPILFTSDEAVKQPGQWGGIDVRGGASTNTVLENCVIECAGSAAANFGGNLLFEAAPPILVTNCTIRAAAGNGMTIYASDPRVLGCTFANNTNFALVFRPDSLPVLRGNTAQGNGKNALGILFGGISRSGSWTRDNLPYTIIDNVFVNNGVTLTIEPAVTVQFQDANDSLYVDGTLIANGTAANPILFTSDDAVKQPGQWQQISFRDSSDDVNSILNNCIIEYGGKDAEGNLTFFSASPRILNTTIRNSSSDGISCNFSSPQISNCRVLNNGRDGIRACCGSSPIVANSMISGSVGLGVNNQDTSKIIKAENNYWGHPSGPFDNANTDGLGLLNAGGLGDKVSEFVDWSPFLASDPTGGPQGPDIDVTPLSLDFGNVIAGQSTNRTLTVSNLGVATLTVNSFATSDSVFSVVSPPTPFNVPTGGQQVVTVRFLPTATGAQTGTLSLISNDPDEPTTVVSLSGTGVVTNCPALPSGLVAWWRAEGNALDGQGTNHAGLSNGVTFVSGEVGQAFNFDGVNQYVSTPLDVQPSALPSTTWEAWVYPTRINFGRQQILCNDDGGFDRAVLVEGNTFGIFTGNTVWTPVDVTTNQWQHIAVVFTPSNIEFYKNGVRFSLGSAPAFGGSGFKLQIGRNPGFGEYFQGRVDEVSIYNRVLTSNEIAAIYNAGTAGKCGSAPTNASDIDVTPLALNFGNVTVNQSTNLTLTISNVGTTTLTINSITANNARFSVAAPITPFNLAPGTRQLITVTFSPSTVATQNGQLSIISNDPDEATAAVSMSGNGVAGTVPDIAAPLALDFGNVTVGQTKNLSLAITNVGSATLTINSITANNARFSTTAPATPFNLPAGAPQLITVTFLPLAVGTQSSQLSIASNDPDEATVTVSLEGFGVGAGTNCVAPPAGLVGWWPGNGNANDIRSGNNGTFLNGSVFSGGVVGQAFNFNGINSYVSIPDNPALHLTSAVTIAAWVNPRSYVEWGGILSKGPIGAPPPLLSYALDTKAGGFFKLSLAWGQETVISQQHTANTWHYVVGTWDGATAKIYVNGVLENQVAHTALLNENNGILAIGTDPPGGVEYFDGWIDEVQLYNRALAASEILAIFNANSGGTCVTAPPSAPDIDVTPIALNFGNITVGQTNTLSVSITNAGTGTLSLNSLSVSSTAFSLAANPAPLNLGPGAGTVLQARFHPAATGAYTGTLTIGSNDPDEPIVTRALTGIAINADSQGSLLVAWGNNRAGTFGNGTQIGSAVPISIVMTGALAGRIIASIASGVDHTIALTEDGKLFGFGFNFDGEVGDGTLRSLHTLPVPVVDGALAGRTVTAISAGFNHNLALTSDGRVFAWGAGWAGQLGNGTTNSSGSPVAVDMNGALLGKTVSAIAAGASHSVALTSDGRVYAWGDGAHLGTGTATSSLVPVAVNMSGALSGKTVTAISANSTHTLALTSEGKVYGWGDNAFGELGNGTETSSLLPVPVFTGGVLSGKSITAISAGQAFSLALASDGTAFSWGANGYNGHRGALGDGTLVNTINVPVAVRMDGALSGKTIVALQAGGAHCLALGSDGKLYTWGRNLEGQLGIGSNSATNVPVLVDNSGALAGKTISRIATGYLHSFALIGPPPPLAAQRSVQTQTLTLSWPATLEVRLEAVSSLSGSWETAPEQPILVGGQKVLTITPSGTYRFFRLVIVP